MTEITDADRKAAAGFFRDERTNLSVKFSLGANPAPLLEAFAAHRMQERDRVVAWLWDQAGIAADKAERAVASGNERGAQGPAATEGNKS